MKPAIAAQRQATPAADMELFDPGRLRPSWAEFYDGEGHPLVLLEERFFSPLAAR